MIDIKPIALIALKSYLRASDSNRARFVNQRLSISASREREANRNGQRDMGAHKQDQERTATVSADTYRIGRSPSLLDRCS